MLQRGAFLLGGRSVRVGILLGYDVRIVGGGGVFDFVGSEITRFADEGEESMYVLLWWRERVRESRKSWVEVVVEEEEDVEVWVLVGWIGAEDWVSRMGVSSLLGWDEFVDLG